MEKLNAAGRLRVLLKRAVGLQAADINGKSDPYVVMMGGRMLDEQKSRVIKNTLDPVMGDEIR